jgi:endonuclease/exonuclease/phosphatase family metal-dependent hydrolase
MPHHVFGPTVDDMWGNAVISRYPIVESSVARLPEAPVTLYARNYVRAVIDIGAGERLTVIATHLTHVDDEGAVEARQAQAAALIAAWAGQPRSLVLGDLNAEPGDPDLESLRRAGLVDAMVSAGGPGPGYTSTARVPSRRIDTVWLSPDLFARELVTGTSRASDHLPVSVTVAPR